jgi:hypothetical protein
MTFPTSRIDETINSATGRLESGDDVRKDGSGRLTSRIECEKVVACRSFLVLGNRGSTSLSVSGGG